MGVGAEKGCRRGGRGGGGPVYCYMRFSASCSLVGFGGGEEGATFRGTVTADLVPPGGGGVLVIYLKAEWCRFVQMGL